MGNPKGVRRDFEELEQRRFLAAKFLQQGFPQAEVARGVGVHRQSVGRWAAALAGGRTRGAKESGTGGTKAAPEGSRPAADRAGTKAWSTSLGIRDRFVDR